MYRFNIHKEKWTIKLLKFKYNPCIGSISKYGKYKIDENKFKYNPCIGSIQVEMITTVQVENLNTTHVSVQFITVTFFPTDSTDLNTTHVSVQ